MNAAIYARKSTEQTGVADEMKSVTRQVDGARAFIEWKGWAVAEDNVYVDDGISGAVFTGRPALQRMLADAQSGVFKAVVLYDLDRLGRDGQHTMNALYALDLVGVTVWDYSTRQPVDLDSFETRLPTILKTEFAQQYREQVSKHTKAAKRRSAEQGYVTGGKLFGYTNHRLGKGQTIRKVNDAEADVVRRIYTLYANGAGLRAIANVLNSEGVPSPRAQRGRPCGWSYITIRDVLARQTYRGVVEWGKTRNARKREFKRLRPHSRKEEGQVHTPESEWLRREDESLRIIDVGLAAAVDARRAVWGERTEVAKAKGRAPQNAGGKYLLSGGMLVCGDCGGHFEAYVTSWKPEPVYVCATRRRKPGVCGNKAAIPIFDADNPERATRRGRFSPDACCNTRIA